MSDAGFNEELPNVGHKDTDPSTMPSFVTEQKAIDFVMNRWRNPWVRARNPWVRRFLLNHAFLGGYHYVRHTGYSIVPIRKKYPNQVRSVINVLKPTARTMLSLLTKNRPQWDVTAQTGDYVDEAQAQVGRNALRGMWHILNQPEQNSHLWLNMMKGGTAFKRLTWDAYGGPPDEVQMTDEDGNLLYIDLDDSEGATEVIRTEQEVEEIIMRETMTLDGEMLQDEAFARFTPLMDRFPGEVACDVWTCMEGVAAPQCINMGEAQVFIWERAHTLDFIRERFPERGHLVKPESDVVILFDGAGGTARMLPGIEVPRVVGGQGYYRSSEPPVAVVREVMIKPLPSGKNPLVDGGKAPDGVHFIFAGDVPLTDLDNPLPYAMTPGSDDPDLDFDGVDYRWFPEPGFWGSDYMTDLIPIIRSMNRRDSQAKASLNAFVHPKALVPMGSKLKKGAFSDQAGDIIKYVGAAPSYLEPPNLPASLYKTMETDTQHYNDISMLHEVMRQGTVPPNMRTAAGLRLLQEIDSLALANTITMYEEQEGKLGQKILDRMKQFYPAERLINFVGDRNRFEVEIFKREKFFSHRWKVYVHPGSAFPELRAAKVAEALEIIQFAPWMLVNASTGMPDKSLFARMVGREEFQELLDDLDESRQAAEAENTRMAQGEQVLPPFAFEEHDTHLMAHYAVMRSPDFREMPQEVQQTFLQHASAHEQALKEAAQAQAQSAQMIQEAATAGQQAVATQAAAEAAAAEAREIVREDFTQGPDQDQNELVRALRQAQGGLPPQQGGNNSGVQ